MDISSPSDGQRCFIFGWLFRDTLFRAQGRHVVGVRTAARPPTTLAASVLFRPAVPYFVTSAGIDLVTGLITAFLVGHIVRRKEVCFNRFVTPLPVAILAVLICLSTVLAIARNLWQSTSEFLIVPFINQALRFKLFMRGNDFRRLRTGWLFRSDCFFY